MGEMADQTIQDGFDSMFLGEDEWGSLDDGPDQDEFDIDECEYCGEPGKMRVIDGTPFNCGTTQRIMCDACFADEMV